MEQEPEFEQGNESESQEIANILRGFGEEHSFDEQTCDEIAAMSFPDAFETAYNYLSQTDLDPDEILADFMEEPKEE